MDYQATTNWMFSKLPMYQDKGVVAFNKDLTKTKLLAKHLSNPEKKIKSIHVGGTNGKGSTSHMLAAVLQQAGYKVGLFTSPHLKDFRERIKVNGQMISEDEVINFIHNNKVFLNQHQLSFFEMTVGMAFEFFAKQRVDIAVVEVGLGGRLDSTNIIKPEVSVITNIGMDHTQFLGNSLQSIANEKAGIIKTHTPVVIGETQKEVSHIFINQARKKQSDIHFADQEFFSIYSCSLKGNYQSKNLKTALKTIQVLKTLGFEISESHIQKGLQLIQQLTALRGRWDVICETPKIICDTAHNKEGLTLVLNQLQQEDYHNLHIVLGFVNDKNIGDLVHLFPIEAQYYFCKPHNARGQETTIVEQIFSKNGRKGDEYASVVAALFAAKKNALNQDVIFVGGSTFVVAEVL